MNKQEFIIKRYQLEHLVPLVLTIVSICFWVFFFSLSFFKITGIIVNIIGLVVWWSAKLTLAHNWDAGYGKPKIKQLVTHGIYSKICHPLYWGINLTLFGLIFLYSKIWFVVVSFLIIIYFFHRMKVEDKFLLEKLGQEYYNYKKRTWI